MLAISSGLISIGCSVPPYEFKRIAMRSDKTDKSFAAMIYYAGAAMISSR
jgi:hypothetical protein